MTDSQGFQRRLPRLECILTGGGVITRIQSRLGGIEITACVLHIRRCALLRLRLVSGGQRLTRVAHLLHGRAGAGMEHCSDACDRKQTQGAGRDVFGNIQGITVMSSNRNGTTLSAPADDSQASLLRYSDAPTGLPRHAP